MGGPGNTSSDILGIEVGRSAVRGVRLDQETTELTAAAECPFDPSAISIDGIIDPATVGPALDTLIQRLGVEDRSQVRVGFTIGPRNSGVGSGPAMTAWLDAQVANLQEPMTCSGGLGIAFVPSRAIDAAVKLAHGSGLDLVRVDLAPVAAARAIGDQVEDVICVGSGRGWQARMRDFEVLEAMENPEIGYDDALCIVGAEGPPRSISRYGWVEVAAELDQSHRLEIGQLATAVGVAIGVAYESPANLLTGNEIASGLAEPDPSPTLGLEHLADYKLEGSGADATLQLASRIEMPTPVRQPREQTRPTPPPERAKQQRPQPEPVAQQTPAPVPLPAAASGSLSASAPAPERAPKTDGRVGKIAPPRRGLSHLNPKPRQEPETVAADPWGQTVDESDPITMFSPDTEVRHMMGKRDSRLGPDVLFGVLLVTAVVLLLVYLYL